jgi:hypothetical protein
MFILILQRKPKRTNPQTNTQTSEPMTHRSQPSKDTRPLKNSHPTKKSQHSKKTQPAKKTPPAKRTQPAKTQPNGSSVILHDIDPEFEALAADLASAFEATQSQPNVNSVMNSIPSAATKPVKYFMVFVIFQFCLVFI